MYRSLIPLSLSLLAAMGCTDAATADDTGVPLDDGPMVSLELTVGDFLSLEGIVDLEVCVMRTDNCVLTDGSGLAILTVPADADVGITIEGGGYTPTLLPYRTTETDLIVSIYLTPVEIFELVFDGLGVDPSKSQLTVTLAGGGAGYAATLDSNDPVHYWTDLGTSIDDSLDATSSSGRFAAVNLTGDMVTIGLEGPGSCTTLDHYWSAGPNEAVLPLEPGFYSGITLDCP